MDVTPTCKWDEEEQKYYKPGVTVPIDITDEEYQEILKYTVGK